MAKTKQSTDKQAKAQALREKDVAGLREEIVSLQKAHFGLRMQAATQQLSNNNVLRQTRCDIARAKTILNQKLAAEQAAKAN